MPNVIIPEQYCYVYILKSLKDGFYYVGSTVNLKQRMKEHAKGEVLSTRYRLPMILVYYEAGLKEKDARMREKYLKTSWGKRYIKNRMKYYLAAGLSMLFMAFCAITPVKAGELQDHFTISLWTKPESSVASQAVLVKNNELRLVTDGSGNPSCQIHNGTAWQTAAVSSEAIALNSWANLACIYDKSELAIYVNGIKKGYQSLSVSLQDTSNKFKAGEDDGGTYSDYTGLIDDVRIYNYARTQKQILEDMNAGRPAIESPVLHLTFDEGYGSTAYDSSIHKNNGTLNAGGSGGNSTVSAMWDKNGKFGGAMEFDGTNDYVITNSTVGNLSSGMSISLWIKPIALDSGSDNFTSLIGNMDNTGSVGTGWGLQIDDFGTKTKTIQFVYYDYHTATKRYIGRTTADGVIENNDWYHIVGIWDGALSSGSGFKIFVNSARKDVAEYSDNTPIPAYLDGTSSTRVGNGICAAGPCGNVNGYIDDVRIYNFALNEDEVKLLYNQGAGTVMGTLGGPQAPGSATSSNAAGLEYCVPGSTDYCAPPVGEWKFDEKASSTAYDTSGNGNNGILGNWTAAYKPVWDRGKLGGGLRFDGVDDYLRIDGPISNFVAPEEGTIEVWIKPKGTPPSSHSGDLPTIINDDIGNGTNGADIGITVGIATNGGSLDRIWLFNWDGSYDHIGIPYDLNKWVHITWLHSGGYLYGYKNGVLIDSIASGNSTALSREYFFIGKRPTKSAFDGLIDNVRIYNYARTPAQIAWEYNKGAPIAHWKFDECQGGTILDWAPGADGEPANANPGQLVLGATGVTATGTCASSSNSFWYNGRSGKYNSAGSFDGGDDAVNIGSAAIFDNMAPMTWSAWIYPDNTSVEHFVINKLNGIYTGRTFGMFGGGRLTFYIWRDSVSAYNIVSAYNTLSVGSWQHITVTWSGNISEYAKLYHNGREVVYSTQQLGSGTLADDNANDLMIGNRPTSDAEWDGLIDEVKIFNYALTEEQVKMEYAGGAVRFE